jgi:hypothetical protein
MLRRITIHHPDEMEVLSAVCAISVAPQHRFRKFCGLVESRRRGQ